MTDYLVFHLYGPLASWGDTAVGEFRPSLDHPSRSAILGLIAASLGVRREDEAILKRIAASYALAVAVESSGTLLRDYHTTAVPPSGKGKNRRHFATRKDELSGPKDGLSTILSSRDYRCDSKYLVCVWPRNQDCPYSLSEIQSALASPRFVPYLGRKSCVLSLPMAPVLINAANAGEAIDTVLSGEENDIPELRRNKNIRVFWSAGDDTGIQPKQSVHRRDEPFSRKPWQFTERIEEMGYLKKEGEDVL